MCTIIGSSVGKSVLIVLFQLYGSKAGRFESNLFWLDQYDPSHHIGRRTNPILI